MREVRSWLRAYRRRLERLPTLEDALLGDGAVRYAAYRLRYVLVRAVLRTSFRLAELGLFASTFPFEILGPVLVARSVLLASGGLWWGALETLRHDVASLSRRGRTAEASQRIAQWLGAALAVSLLVLAAAGFWVGFGPSPFQSFNVVDVYVLGCALRWGADVLARTYHSGVYGVRRVYRPAWSLLLVDLADIAVLGLCYWWIGPWGLGVAIGVGGLVRAALSVAFTRRVYRQLKLVAGRVPTWMRALLRGKWSPRDSLRFALGNAVAQIDALLVLALISAPGNPSGALLLAALFFVLSPLQSASFTWARLFYFDFKRLEGWGSPYLLKQFEQFLANVAWWVPAPIGIITLGLMAALWRGPYVILTLELVALSAVRSWLSLVHIRAYSLADHRYLAKLLLGMFLVLGVTLLGARLEPELSLGILVVSAALGLLLLGRSVRPLAASHRTLVGPSTWVAELAATRAPVRLGLARVDRRLTTVGRVIKAVRPALDGAVVARITRDTFVWFELIPGIDPGSAPPVLEYAAGCLRELCIGEVALTGMEAIRQGLTTPSWDRQLGQALGGAPELPKDVTSLRAALRTMVADAEVVDLTTSFRVGALPPYELRRLVLEATRGRGGFRRVGEREVAVLAPGGLPWVLVVCPRASGETNPWKASAAALVRSVELAKALTSARGPVAHD